MVDYLFRVPKFPILIESDTLTLGASSRTEVNEVLKKGKFGIKDSYVVVDATAEGWSYLLSYQTISPLTLRKRFSKKEIVQLVNIGMTRNGQDEQYVCRSLSNRRLEQIVGELTKYCKQL